ncbi:hypothetical protein ACFWIY_05745 [Streptomyces sioyaensis]|uniref:hypothetical protein n=1 Tax=Streptomyces sioyaensis TaxID=67364 RepID=UPI0036473580
MAIARLAGANSDGPNQIAVVVRGTIANPVGMLEDLDVGTVVPFTAGGSPDVAVITGQLTELQGRIEGPQRLPAVPAAAKGPPENFGNFSGKPAAESRSKPASAGPPPSPRESVRPCQNRRAAEHPDRGGGRQDGVPRWDG